MEYDAEGRQTKTTDPLGRVTETFYDQLGRRAVVKHPDGTVYGQSSNPEWDSQEHPIAEYDELGRVRVQYDERGSTTTMVYDILGRAFQTIDALGHVMETEYDAAGQRVATIDALNRRVEFVYDNFGRLKETKFPKADEEVGTPDHTYKRTTYNKRGQAIAEEDQNGNVTAFGFDDLGRLESVTDAEDHTWTYGYDEGGAQTSQTDANDHTTNWTYDLHGRKKTRTLPMGQTETFQYDIVGNMFEHHRFDHHPNEDPDLNDPSVMLYEFDGSGREVGRFDPEISTSTVTTAYDLAGQRVKVDDNLGTTRYEYDLRGRMTAEIKFSGEALVYEYDQNGNQTRSLVYSDDSRTTQLMETIKTYDRLNRLETVTSDPGTWTYTYNEVGSRAAQINPNGTRTDYEYDNLNRLRKIHTYKDNASPTPDVDINVFEYTLDNVGNRTHIYEYQNTGSSIVEATLDYVYDDTYKLLSEERTDEISEEQVYLREYEYDPVGNRLLQRTTAGETVEERTYPAETAYDANDRLLEERVDDEVVTTYEYDDRGNTTAKFDAVDAGGSVFYTWDHRDRLVRADRGESIDEVTLVAAYEYDASGMRVHKSVGTASADKVNYLIDYRNGTGYSQVVRETDGTEAAIVSYLYGDDLLSQTRLDVPGSIGSPVTSLYHYDGLGSVRALSDATAGVAGSYRYYGFGETFGSAGGAKNDYLFAGEQIDTHTGFYNLRARNYDFLIGRFHGLDSYHGNGQDPSSLHKYTYAGHNPVLYSDPTGLFSLLEVVSANAIQLDLIHTDFKGSKQSLDRSSAYIHGLDDFQKYLNAVEAGIEVLQVAAAVYAIFHIVKAAMSFASIITEAYEIRVSASAVFNRVRGAFNFFSLTKTGASGLRLNVGSGRRPRAGYVNIDNGMGYATTTSDRTAPDLLNAVRDGKTSVDIVADARNLPFKEKSAAELLYENFPSAYGPDDFGAIAAEASRVAMPGATVYFSCNTQGRVIGVSQEFAARNFTVTNTTESTFTAVKNAN